MSSLSTKYRPTDFNSVVGQDSVVMILRKQIQANKIKNAYLFHGSSGCGKTTLARLVAKELNGTSDTAIEIDAASNTGVDNIRDIIKSANEYSLNSKYKIFIIDECHMLSNSAWNALLKTIEEPPKYTIFIFCTTNIDKVPDTIKNRCQRFDFTKIPSVLINERLKFICCQEGFTNYEESCEYISKNCNNQMRDAITYLEQVADLSTDLSIELTNTIIGNGDYKTLFTIINNIIDGDQLALINNIEVTFAQFININAFVNKLLSLEMDIIKYLVLNNMNLLTVPISFESDIKNTINFDNAKQVHTYLLNNIVELHNQNNLNQDVILAYLLKMARFE